MTDIATDDRVLEIERRLKASPEKVFDAWTRPDLLVQWWGPEGFTTPDHDLNVEPGGAWTTTMKSPEGNLHTCSGVYRTIDRPNRLEFTWAWTQDDGSRGHETVVTVTFERADGGTRMCLLQKTFQNSDARDSHNGGWVSAIACLERFLSDRAAA